MTKAIKKPKRVLDAEAVCNIKFAAMTTARVELKNLEEEYAAACEEVELAKIQADASLPQCDMVVIRWKNGVEAFQNRVVIVRSTPSGILVVRNVGEPEGKEYRFKWLEWHHAFVQIEKSRGFYNNTSELRDVPAEYLPKHLS
jgi:hypothetical protein